MLYTVFISSYIVYTRFVLVAEGELIPSLYSLSRRRSEYRLVITEPEATNGQFAC